MAAGVEDEVLAASEAGRALGGQHGAGLGVEDSEDIVQDALLAMHLKRDTWDDSQPLEPWLRAIAHHKMVDHLRRRHRRG